MTDQETEILTLQAALGEAHAKLFEAGRFAGQQQALIDGAKVTLEWIADHSSDPAIVREAYSAIEALDI